MTFWSWLWAKVIASLVGDGLGAEVAGRASAYLLDEAAKAIDRDEVPVSRVRLRPGESYTVLARPAPTRRERRLAKRKAALQEADRRLGRSTRRQRRIARRLRHQQRQLDRRRPGTRRHARAAAREALTGARFDRVMTPTRRHRAVRDELGQVSTELDDLRARRFAAARAKRGMSGRPEHVEWHDASD
ncbi:MAG: hypothetical protein JST64_08720 [Actinobacteria bacterium]|nr:hypothetical protein [Actinomycetota bacterium]